MLDRKNIHNSAILKPHSKKQFKRCDTFFRTKRHPYVDLPDGINEQCIDCGRIKKIYRGKPNGIHRHNQN